MKPGVYTALVTPFKSAGFGLEEDLFRRLIERQIEAGVTGLIINGSTGEGQTQNQDEWDQTLKIALSYQDKIQIGGACGASSTWETLDRFKKIKKAGCHFGMVSTPPYNKPPQRGLVQYFKTIAENVPDLELLVYNVPGRTAINLELETIQLLWKIPSIIGMKEASGNWDQVEAILKSRPSKKLIFSGEDPLNAKFYQAGANGIVSVLSNIVPKACVKQWKAAQEKDWDSVLSIQEQTKELTRLLFVESNPIPVKWGMGQILDCDMQPRSPLPSLKEHFHRPLREQMKTLESLGY